MYRSIGKKLVGKIRTPKGNMAREKKKRNFFIAFQNPSLLTFRKRVDRPR